MGVLDVGWNLLKNFLNIKYLNNFFGLGIRLAFVGAASRLW